MLGIIIIILNYVIIYVGVYVCPICLPEDFFFLDQLCRTLASKNSCLSLDVSNHAFFTLTLFCIIVRGSKYRTHPIEINTWPDRGQREPRNPSGAPSSFTSYLGCDRSPVQRSPYGLLKFTRDGWGSLKQRRRCETVPRGCTAKRE